MRALVMSVAVALLLVACGGDPEVKEPTATPAPTTSPPSPAPSMPAQAEEDSTEGAAAFVNYWVKISNQAARAGDVAELRRISDPSCEGCNRYIDLYEETYRDGGFFRGGDRTLNELEVEWSKGSSTFLYAEVRAEKGKFKATSSAAIEEAPADSTQLAFAARFAGKTWQMEQVALDER